MAKHIHIHFAPRRAVVADAVRRFLDQAPGSVPQGDDMTALVDALHAAIAAREGTTQDSEQPRAANGQFTQGQRVSVPDPVNKKYRIFGKYHSPAGPKGEHHWVQAGSMGEKRKYRTEEILPSAGAKDADWDESQHPRDEGGRWTSGQHQAAAQRHEQLAGMHKASPVGQAHAKAAEAHQLAAHHLNTQTGWAEHHVAKAHQLSAAANQASALVQTPEQLKQVAADPKASVEERAAAVQQLDKMEQAANAVASSPHAIPKPAAPAMAHSANDPYRQSGGGEQMAHGGPQGAKPTKAVNTASTKAATHELLSTGHPFSIDELMAATGAKSKVTLMTALSDLKNPKYAGKLGNLEIVKRPDGMYHVAKAPAGGFTAPKPADTNAAPAAAQQPGAEASADPTAVASGSHPLSDYMPGQTLTAKGASGKQYKVLGHNAAGNVVIQSPTGTKHHMEPAALKNATLPPPAKPNAGAEQSKPDPVTGMPSGMVSPADREKIQAAQVKQASLTPKQAEKQDVEAALARPLDKPAAPSSALKEGMASGLKKNIASQKQEGKNRVQRALGNHSSTFVKQALAKKPLPMSAHGEAKGTMYLKGNPEAPLDPAFVAGMKEREAARSGTPIPRWPRSERTATTTKPAPAFSLGWIGGTPGSKEEPPVGTLHTGITKSKLAQKGVDVKHIGTQPLPQQRQMLLDLARQHGVKPQYTVPADPNAKPDMGDGLTPQQRSAKRSDAYLKQRWIKK